MIVTQILGIFFDSPGQIAKNTTIPAAAEKEGIPIVRAMGLVQTLEGMAMFLGPLSAGLVIAVLSESVILAIAGVLFFLSIIIVTRVQEQIMVHEHPMSAKRAYHDMREAAFFIIHEPFLGKMQIFGPLYGFFLLPVLSIIFPAWFVVAGQSSSALGIFLSTIAIGGIVGGAFFSALGPKVSQRAWLGSATAIYAPALFVMHTLQPGTLAVTTVGAVAGFVFTGIMAVPYTAFYIRTPQKLLGRVNALGFAMVH